MSGKVIILITAMAALFSLTMYTLGRKQEGYENVVENKDFLIKGIKHDSAVAGGWKGKDFVLTVKVNSGDYRLDLKVVLKDGKRSVNGNVGKDKSCQSKRGKVLNFPSCKANKTRPLTSSTCKPRPPMIIYKAHAACKSCALAALNWWMTGPKRLSKALESIYNGSIWLGSKGYSGVAFAMEWTGIKVTSLACKAYGGLAVALEWSWVQLKSFALGAWRVAMWMSFWTWYGFAGLAKGMWYVLLWICTGIWILTEWIGDAISTFYNFYLKAHVTHIEGFVASLSTPQRIILVSVMGNAVFFVMWMIGALLDYRLKRQERLEMEAAEEAAAAAAASTSRRRRKGQNQNQNPKNKPKKKSSF